MKRFLFLKLSPAVVAVVIFLLLVGAGVWAYIALQGSVEVTVEEPLSFVGTSTFQVTAYAGESATQTVTVANAASVSIGIDIPYNVDPDPSGEVTISVPNAITIPATGQLEIDIDIDISKSAAPAVYTITYDIVR